MFLLWSNIHTWDNAYRKNTQHNLLQAFLKKYYSLQIQVFSLQIPLLSDLLSSYFPFPEVVTVTIFVITIIFECHTIYFFKICTVPYCIFGVIYYFSLLHTPLTLSLLSLQDIIYFIAPIYISIIIP